MSYQTIFKEVLKENLPTKDEKKKIEIIVEGFVSELQKRVGTEGTVKVGGSFAKGTFLKKDFDCDVFVMFDDDKNASDRLEEILKGLRAVRVHGSRDYFQLVRKGVKFEIVPVLKIDKSCDANNVTDCSPIHVDWIKKKITKRPGLSTEVVLAKLFMKSIGTYGAESYIKGFSGHVLDILITYYGSFLKLLSASQKWKVGEIIDIEKHSGKLNDSKTYGPLIVVDPIQEERNAAAALGKEKFEIFISKAKEFLENPDKKYFVKEKFSILKINRKNDVVLSVSALEGKQDVVGAKLLKVFESIGKKLKEFEVVDSGWHWDKDKMCYMWYKLSSKEIGKEYEHMGPPKKARKNFNEFVKKHKNYYLKGDRAYVMIKRKHTAIKPFVKDLLKDNYIKERVVSIKNV